MRIARPLATSVALWLAASLTSCSPPAPIVPPVEPPGPPAVTAPPAVEAPAVTPWFSVRAEHPAALFNALDQARDEAPGTLARWLFGAPPTASEEPLRAWVVGEADAPSLWLSWAGAPASPAPGALLSCGGAAHVCATKPNDLARAAAFASAQSGDASAANRRPEPAIVATFPRAALERAVPVLVARAAGVLGQLAEAGAATKNMDAATLDPIVAVFRNRYMVENHVQKALSDIEKAEIRLGVAQGGFRIDAELLFNAGGSSPLVTSLVSPSNDDGVALSTLARHCPAESTFVLAARVRAQDGVPGAVLAVLLQMFARGLHDEQFSSALRSAWDATSASSVTCQAWGPDGKTISLGAIALRDAKAAARALARVNTVRVKNGELNVELRRSGKTVTLDVLRGAQAQSLAIGVVGDSLVLIMADKAGKRLDALRAAPLPPEPPLVAGLDAAPFLFGLDVSKALRVEGNAVVRGRVESSAPGQLHATVHASGGMIAFLGNLGRALESRP